MIINVVYLSYKNVDLYKFCKNNGIDLRECRSRSNMIKQIIKYNGGKQKNEG